MFTYDGPNLRIDDPALDHVLNSRDGDVGKYMHELGLKIQVAAKAAAPIKTGALKASIYLKHETIGRRQQIRVGSELRYALVVHEGEKPHEILPHHAGVLRFNEGGRIVYARHVHHPGFRGRKYLVEPMRIVVSRG